MRSIANLTGRRSLRWRGLRFLGTLLAGWAGVLGLQAEFLQPVSVTVSNGEDVKDAVINGQGLDDAGLGNPAAIHTPAGSEMWSSIGSIRAELVFDLGKTVDLSRVYLWNYNAGLSTDWGMKDVQLFVSPDSNPATARFTGIAEFTLTEGGETAQAFDVKGTNVRLVKVRNTSNWGNGYAIGLAEARFESSDLAGNVPVVLITGLKDGDTVPYGSDFALSATVTDGDNNLAKVEFFDGTTKLSETNRTPYTTSLKSLEKGDHTLRVVATDATGYRAFGTVGVNVREIVPGKIVQVDDERDIGTGLHQIRYSGAWNLAPGNENDPRFLHNDHYSDASGAFFEVKFVGVKIDVFATVASHHGTASASIDGGTRYVLNYKTAQRAEQKLIWSSPLLPNREHTLRVTVLGTGVVTADRFDITQSDTPSDERATLKKWDVAPGKFTLEIEDLGTSQVDTNTVTLKVDGASVPVQVSKSGALTTIVYTPARSFDPGSQHPFQVQAKDKLGNTVGSDAVFTVPSPPFPLTGLGEPPAKAGNWSVRQIWSAGRADAVVTAVALAQAVGKPGFAGKTLDVDSPTVNFNFTPSLGNTGLFSEDAPFPGEAQEMPTADWVTVARARVHIPRDGDYTIGVHSDDGFALRFAGHPFASVTGLGSIDEDFPEYISYAVGTGDSNTRGVLKGVRSGHYVVEFIHFQRVGGAAAEVYAAEGEFAEDADAPSWALIGGPDGLELMAEEIAIAPFSLGSIRHTGSKVTIDFNSPKPAGPHALFESSDLVFWVPVAGAVFTSAGGASVQVTVNNPITARSFYRVQVGP